MTSQLDYEVAIIGAGLGGLGAAIELSKEGINDFVILERAGDIGGTWRDNTYPGIAVDVPAQAYQFSYELKPTWSRIFAKGAEVKAYVDQCADHYDLRSHIRLNSEVMSRTWDDDRKLWRLQIGTDQVLNVRFVISAIGAFVEPKPIEIPGVDSFAGKVLHSARWDHEYDLANKRVAIIGTGASAVQIIPEIVPKLAHLDVYQRTPIWVGPKIDPVMPKSVQRLFTRSPGVQQQVRRFATRLIELGLVDLVRHHEKYPYFAKGAAMLGRQFWYRLMVRDPEIRRKLTPQYGLGCKRPSVSNGYLRSFNKPHVTLITDTIQEVTPNGVRTVDGVERPVDVLILATGFRMSSDPENYRRTPVRGRDGFDLANFYESTRLESYESISIPKLPNHFMIFGPYGWTGGTWHVLVETASVHIARVIKEAHRRNAVAVEATQEATERWTNLMRERMSHSLFNTNNCSTANSYYFDHHGDTPFLRPTSAADAWVAARNFPFEDYEFTPKRETVQLRLPDSSISVAASTNAKETS